MEKTKDENIIKEPVTFTNEFRMNVCEIKGHKDNTTRLIKERFTGISRL